MTDTNTTAPPRVWLGKDLQVPVLGLGTMGMAEFYGPSDEEESVATIHRALELGIDFIDTAYMYGGGRSERIVGKALAGTDRDAVTLATKCGLIRTPDNVRIDGSPAHIRHAIDESLTRLGTDHVDLYYLHRVDPDVPVEESIGAMSELVAAGKVRYLGISEAAEGTLRRAHATHPMTALQSEFSLATREPEHKLLPVCEELGIGFVAWGPLSRGLLTGTVREADFGSDDVRSILPRFSGEVLESNVALVDKLAEVADGAGCSLSQLALAWTMAKGAVPIQGAMNRAQLEENVGAARLALSPDVLAAVDAVAPEGAFEGPRFHAPMLNAVEK
ncbi:aldo/keto reductase [Streptomyces sp. HPF1205]|uniref:aldo/keto reductase n=1 Tax=Streptomyces sp. HPF1205 TaxID=2873262 RepID=UPI001CED8E4D|nr:aldo/keto reductase [Streptomyces sp. HPF1205]